MNIVLDAAPTTPADPLRFSGRGGRASRKGADREPPIAPPAGTRTGSAGTRTGPTARSRSSASCARKSAPEIGPGNRHGGGLGVIDVEATGIEGAETGARRIERAADASGTERIRPVHPDRGVHPDCGVHPDRGPWSLSRHMADGKSAAIVAGRGLYEGRYEG